MYEELRKNKTAIYDEKVKPFFEELLPYGYGDLPPGLDTTFS